MIHDQSYLIPDFEFKEFLGYGGGKINRKMLFAVLFLLALTLPFNGNTVSAVTQNPTNATNTDLGTTHTTVQPSNTTTSGAVSNTSATNGTATNGTTSNQLTNSSNGTSTPQNGTKYAAGSPAAATSTVSQVIKVLIYSGAYASANCVNGLETALDYANNNSLIPGVTFSYATSTVINAAVLAGYNLLVMPGGDGGSLYLNSGSISGTAIKNFVANGGGYLGICAGAYAGAASVDGMYNGWGVAPDVKAKAVSYVGQLPMTFTSAGQQVIGRSGTISIMHYNGAAMYTTSSKATIFATFADGSTGYNGYADIVGDVYGNGRSVLIGSHPELSPQYPDIIARLIVWATSTSTNTGTGNNTGTGSVTLSQLTNAAASVKNYYETNKVLPNYVTISNQQLSMSQFLYLLASGTLNINSGSTASIPVKNVNAATSPSGTIKAGNILKSEYVSIAQNIKTFIDTNGRAPNYVSTSLGQMRFDKLVYMFSKIVNYYQSNGRLPNYVSMS